MAWITIRGLPELVAKLNADRLLGQQWREIVTATVAVGVQRAQRRAPAQQAGRLAAAITSTIDFRPVPLWGRIELAKVTNPEDENEVAFGSLLNASSLHHYRAGRRRGKPTQGWFRGVQKSVRGRLNFKLRELAKAVEVAWNK